MINLKDLIVEIETLASTIDVKNIISKFNWSKLPQIYTWTHAPYYSCLAAAAKILNPNQILEIGTFTGASALCLAAFGHKVNTYDIRNQFFDQTIMKYINFNILTQPTDCTELSFNLYDLIFIDIGIHSGEFERIIHNKLVTGKYKGIVFWDDINYNSTMSKMWKDIQQPKIETHWNTTNFGVVLYD